MKYSLILWDADDTLLDFHAAEAYSFKKTMKEEGLPFDEDSVKLYNEINQKMWEQFNLGKISKDALIVERFSKYFEAKGIKEDAERINKMYLENLADCSVLVDGALDIVRKLDELGLEQYIVTNGISHVAHKRIGNSEIKPYIKKIFVSEDVGYAKPDINYFNYVFSNIENFNKDKAIIIGDSCSSDIKGGMNAGISTCLYNPKGNSFADEYKVSYEIKKLDELLDIL